MTETPGRITNTRRKEKLFGKHCNCGPACLHPMETAGVGETRRRRPPGCVVRKNG